MSVGVGEVAWLQPGEVGKCFASPVTAAAVGGPGRGGWRRRRPEVASRFCARPSAGGAGAAAGARATGPIAPLAAAEGSWDHPAAGCP